MSREALSKLRARITKVAENTRQVRAEVEQKREERKVEPFSRRPPAPVLTLVPVEAETARVAPKRAVTAHAVEAWFKSGLVELFGPSFVVPKWTVKQKTLAKWLLEQYGPELTEKGVSYFFENWNGLVKSSRGRLSGAPTVNLLWAMRERIFADVQSGKKQVDPANKDEFRKDDSPDSGW